VKPDVDTLLAVPDDPPAAGPDRALDPPPDPGPPAAPPLPAVPLPAVPLPAVPLLAAAELPLEVALTIP
jgi:hypothetical protein